MGIVAGGFRALAAMKAVGPRRSRGHRGELNGRCPATIRVGRVEKRVVGGSTRHNYRRLPMVGMGWG